MDLNTVMFALLGVLISAYAILDGFDLGVGTLSLFALSREDRDLHIASISPVWDGNQVWLLTTANVLLGAFPIVFTTIFSGLYLALILLLAAFIARAVAVEFRSVHHSSSWVRFWDFAFGIGCLASAILLGAAFGNVLRGLPIGPGFALERSALGIFNPFAILVGLTACALFVMHGGLYLWMKTGGESSNRLARIALRAHAVFLFLYAASIASTVYVSPFLFERAGSLIFCIVALLLAAALAGVPVAIRKGKKGAAFLASSASIALIVMGTALSAHPVLVPSLLGADLSLTIYNASSTRSTLLTMLVIAGAGIPIIFGYTYLVYRVFRGPVRPF